MRHTTPAPSNPRAVRAGLTHQQAPSTTSAATTITRRTRAWALNDGRDAERVAGALAAMNRATARSSSSVRGECTAGGSAGSVQPSRRATRATISICRSSNSTGATATSSARRTTILSACENEPRSPWPGS